MLGELMLYKPVTEEIEIDQVESMYDEMYKEKRKVDIVKSQVMKHLEGVEEARYYVEQVKKEIDLTEVGNQLDPALAQDNADCEEEVMSEHPDFLHVDPSQITSDDHVVTKSIYRKIDIPNDEELKENTRNLDKHQQEVINIGVKYAKDIVKMRREGNTTSVVAPLLMVHGGAGAGKSTVIKVLAQWTQKLLQKEGDDIECPCVI